MVNQKKYRKVKTTLRKTNIVKPKVKPTLRKTNIVKPKLVNCKNFKKTKALSRYTDTRNTGRDCVEIL